MFDPKPEALSESKTFPCKLSGAKCAKVATPDHFLPSPNIATIFLRLDREISLRWTYYWSNWDQRAWRDALFLLFALFTKVHEAKPTFLSDLAQELPRFYLVKHGENNLAFRVIRLFVQARKNFCKLIELSKEFLSDV